MLLWHLLSVPSPLFFDNFCTAQKKFSKRENWNNIFHPDEGIKDEFYSWSIYLWPSLWVRLEEIGLIWRVVEHGTQRFKVARALYDQHSTPNKKNFPKQEKVHYFQTLTKRTCTIWNISFLLSSAEFYWVLLSSTECYWVLLTSTEYYWVLLTSTEFYWVLLSSTEFYWLLLSSTQ